MQALQLAAAPSLSTVVRPRSNETQEVKKNSFIAHTNGTQNSLMAA